MKIHKTYIAVGMIIAFALFFELTAHAGEADQATKITFSQPIQVPGQILPAGTYLFTLANPDDLNMVQIFSPDRTHLYATLQTIPTESRQVADDTTVALAEQGAGKPDVLLKWFYPGEEVLSRRGDGSRVRLLDPVREGNGSGDAANGCSQPTSNYWFRGWRIQLSTSSCIRLSGTRVRGTRAPLHMVEAAPSVITRPWKEKKWSTKQFSTYPTERTVAIRC